jgi:hypothetical protein
MMCPRWELLQKWSYPYENSGRVIGPFSSPNIQSGRTIANFIAEELAAQGTECENDAPVEEKVLKQSDITILIDGSDSIKKQEWKETKDAVEAWMSGKNSYQLYLHFLDNFASFCRI